MRAGRLRGLPVQALPGGGRVFVAATPSTRLLGLALLGRIPADCALLIPGCRSVHTFGMRFGLDVLFLDAEGRVVRVAAHVRPRRVVRCAYARAVLETRAGEAGRFLAASLGDLAPRL